MKDSGAIHQMSAAVGELRAQVAGMTQAIESLNRVWGEREASASAGRLAVHEKIDALRVDVTRLSADVENISNEFIEVKPAIEEFKNKRQQQIGERKLGSKLWGSMLIAAGFTGWGIHEAGIWVHEIVTAWARHP